MEWGMLLWIRFQRWRRERRITGFFDPMLSAELDARIVAEERLRVAPTPANSRAGWVHGDTRPGAATPNATKVIRQIEGEKDGQDRS